MQAILPYLSSPYIPILLLITVTCLLVANILLIAKLRAIFRGSDATSLEPLLRECITKIEELERHDELSGSHTLTLEEKISHAARNLSIIRYKAFESGTSNQSFSVALLNERGDGAIISSLHHRDRVVTYAKPIKEYESEYDLSDEEKHVLEESEKAHKKK
jgi:hypothetical protein